jgi:hypothetical protein
MFDDCCGVCQSRILSLSSEEPLESIGENREVAGAISQRLIDVGIAALGECVGEIK